MNVTHEYCETMRCARCGATWFYSENISHTCDDVSVAKWGSTAGEFTGHCYHCYRPELHLRHRRFSESIQIANERAFAGLSELDRRAHRHLSPAMSAIYERMATALPFA